MGILIGIGLGAGYLAVGATIGTLWAKFMPRWNMMDQRDHVQGCDAPYDSFGGHFLCNCPATRTKTKEAKERDFWVFTFLWIYAIPIVSFAVIMGCMMWLAENGERFYTNNVQQRLRNWL